MRVIFIPYPEELLNTNERALVAAYNSVNEGYNCKDGGDGGRLTDEIKKKISDAKRGKKHSAETIMKMREVQKGKIISPEQKNKIRKTLQGNVPWNKNNGGYKISEEGKRNMRAGAIERFKKNPHSEETKEKIRLTNRGQKRSDETKRKLREAWKRRRQNMGYNR